MKRSKKGFTLAELLIVIAIIAILIAVMFPVFGAQLDKARAAAELANVRAAYSEAVADAMLGDKNDLTGSVTAVEVKWEKLKDACQYTETKVGAYAKANAKTDADSIENLAADLVGAEDNRIYVAYKGYFGSFEIDSDVTIKK